MDASYHSVKTIRDTLVRYQDTREKATNLKEIFTAAPRLIITPSNNCNMACTHCIADSTPKGEMMDYEKFASIDTEFFKLFNYVDFGRRGNPLQYYSQGKDLADMIEHLYNNGIENATIAAAIQRKETEVISKLEALSENGLNIESMITYHHYFNNLDTERLAP